MIFLFKIEQILVAGFYAFFYFGNSLPKAYAERDDDEPHKEARTKFKLSK